MRPRAVSLEREAAIHEAVAEYKQALAMSGAPEPWSLVEHLADELLDEVLLSCAAGMIDAADAEVERVAETEYAEYIGPVRL